jgi:hypothetical protein
MRMIIGHLVYPVNPYAPRCGIVRHENETILIKEANPCSQTVPLPPPIASVRPAEFFYAPDLIKLNIFDKIR